MVSILDVARHANVSAMTVSRVLNNVGTVRPGNRRLVLQAVEELGYVPNASARSLRTAHTKTLGLVVSHLGDPIFHELIAGFESVVAEHGHSVLICDSNSDEEREVVNLKTLYERRVEGLVLYPVGNSLPSLESYLRSGIPVVLADWGEPTPGLPQLPLDHRSGLRKALVYLTGLGHKRIGYIVPETRFGRWREEDYRQAAREVGLSEEDAPVLLAQPDEETVQALRAMLSGANRPTAVVSGSLSTTPHVLAVIYEAHLAIPDDISFVTIGEIPLTTVFRPPLTTLATDRMGRGRMAANYIFACLEGQDAESMLKTWDFDLIVRESCAPPRR